MEIKTKYDLRQLVYLVHDPEQLQRMITGIMLITGKLHQYELACGDERSLHYEWELSTKSDEHILMNMKKEEE